MDYHEPSVANSQSSTTTSSAIAGNRLRRMTAALKDAYAEIDSLKSHNSDLTDRLRTMEQNFRRRLETQRSKFKEIRDEMDGLKSTMHGCLAAIDTNFRTLAEKNGTIMKKIRYKNKLLSDQLAVKRMKVNHLSRRMDTQTKQLARLNRLNTKLKSKETALTLRCVRCKVRKNVIVALENEVTDLTTSKDDVERRCAAVLKEKSELESRLETNKGDVIKSRDQILNLRRNNAILEQELRDEREKVITLQQQAAESTTAGVVEVGRTPTDQQPSTNHYSSHQQHSLEGAFADHHHPTSNSSSYSSIHGKCEAQLSHVRAELQTSQTKLDEAILDRDRLRSELTFYERRCEDMTMDLENSHIARDQKQTELEAANQQTEAAQQQVQLFQALLQNLAAGVFTAMVD